LPDFNRSDGPQVDFSFLNGYVASPSAAPNAAGPSRGSGVAGIETSQAASKRSYSSVSDRPLQEGFADEARSVALDLGLLTLNTDSRQTHYLGTSSGRLFTSLIGAGSPETPPQSARSRAVNQPLLSTPGTTGPFAHTKRARDACHALYDTLKRNMPPEDDARVLLNVYFRDIHVDHPFLHPDSLINAVEALYHCSTADATTEIGYNGWAHGIQPFSYNGEFDVSRNSPCTPISVYTATFHVFMVFTLAATVRTRQKVYDFAPNQFYRVAASAGQQCFSTTSPASLQASLLLAVHSLTSPTDLNIWTLTYVAMAHCVDLGLHRTPSPDSSLSPSAILVRKLMFFSVYHLDR